MRTLRSLLLAAALPATLAVPLIASAQPAPAPALDPAPTAPVVVEPGPEPVPAPVVVEPTSAEPAPVEAAPLAEPAAVAADKKDDKKPDIELKPGGYIQVDGKGFLEEAGVDDFQIKRLRPKLDGVAFGHFPFRVLLDFAGSRIQVLDAWVEVDYHEALVVRVGKDKEQFGLERLQSATALPLIERGLPTQLVPNRDIGVQLRGEVLGGVVRYVGAVFNGTPDVTSSDDQLGDDNFELNGHLFLQPFKKAGPAALKGLGFGGAVTYGRVEAVPGTSTQLINYRTTGGAQFFRWTTSADPTLTAFADGIRTRATGHGHWYWQRIGVLGEYVRAQHGVVLRSNHASLAHHAWQGVATFLVTDDEASYKGVKPKQALGADGIGAIELAARVSQLTIDDETFERGFANPAQSAAKATAFAVGATWYLNSAFKAQLNYEHTAFDGGATDDGDREAENVILGRLQTSI
jgi:phosphate-selective porin OprO/OprP